jgi:excisionase family DNA binding protein
VKQAHVPEKPPRLSLTTGEAAAHCQVSPPALKRWIREGRLRAFKTAGGHARIALDDFGRFLRAHGMPPYPAAEGAGVLIADDEPALVGVLVNLLLDHRPDVKLETASDGYEALIKVGSFKPALLILDVTMPGLDGIEVCRHLKTNPDTRGVKILGITGYRDRIPALLAAGADACLAKPFTSDQIQRELERLLASSEARR